MPLSTGIATLDRKLDGGVHPGSVVAVVAPPDAQVAPLLCASIDRRETRYFATVRTEEGVRRRLERSSTDDLVERIEHVGVADALDLIRDRVADMNAGSDVVVDVVDPLENEFTTGEYVSFLTDFSQRVIEADGVAFLSCLDAGAEPENRELTLSVADYVFRLHPERNGKQIDYFLEVPKACGVSLSADERVFEVEVGEQIRIDRTRNI